MAVFFIDTDEGHVATHRQLVEARVPMTPDGLPHRPWLQIRASGDANTLWHAVLRKRERGIFIGTLVFRHGPHHSLLLERGWEEIPPEAIGRPGAPASTVAPSPWSS